MSVIGVLESKSSHPRRRWPKVTEQPFQYCQELMRAINLHYPKTASGLATVPKKFDGWLRLSWHVAFFSLGVTFILAPTLRKEPVKGGLGPFLSPNNCHLRGSHRSSHLLAQNKHSCHQIDRAWKVCACGPDEPFRFGADTSFMRINSLLAHDVVITDFDNTSCRNCWALEYPRNVNPTVKTTITRSKPP